MAYLNAGHRAVHNFEVGMWGMAGLMAVNAGAAVACARDRIDAQRAADHAALAAERGEAVRVRAAHTINLLARERANGDALMTELVTAKLEAARVIDLEDTVARLRRELRLARER